MNDNERPLTTDELRQLLEATGVGLGDPDCLARALLRRVVAAGLVPKAMVDELAIHCEPDVAPLRGGRCVLHLPGLRRWKRARSIATPAREVA